MASTPYKDDHNRTLTWGRKEEFRDFTDILIYLDHSPLIGTLDLVATIDGHEVVVPESLISELKLQLDEPMASLNIEFRLFLAGPKAENTFTPPCLPLLLLSAGELLNEENAAKPHGKLPGSYSRGTPYTSLSTVYLVRETTPERQPETEWVVPNPVSPGTDWRPWPSCNGTDNSLKPDWEHQESHGGAILTLVSRVKKLERTDYHVWPSEALGHEQATFPSEDMRKRESKEVPSRPPQADISESAGPSIGADKGKAPMPDLEIPAEFLAEDAQARQRLEEEQASARLVQQLQAEDLAQADVPIVSEQRAKELDELMLRMTKTDWLTLMMQVGTNPALVRELLGADVNEDNFIERMTVIKERKKRALADLLYRALKGKPLKQSEVTQMMHNLVKNQWCAAHHGTITMKAVKAMSKQQLIEEYENICRHLEKDRLLSAQYNLFRPKPAITEPPSKRQRVERASSQPSNVPAATT
ncbi:hypothetical protein Tco_1531164 [Tanacetum coccineum]